MSSIDERALLVERRDEVVGVQHLKPVDELDVASRRPGPGPSLSMRTVYVFGCRRLEDDLLQVEDDVGHVFDDVGDGRELVERAFDADGRDGRALERREEHAAERVADGDAEAALERLAR